ncbi:MAG: alpha/beta fold hydrolase [Myxococcales bacterium]|jgi:2-hydroxy-6-oxonona-2,4-dienedioate hydrolase
MSTKRRSIVATTLAPAAVLAGLTYSRYRRDLQRARQRIATGSNLTYTSFGALEYADVGEGPPMLAIHGAGGGWDQGLAIARALDEGFRVIAPSRFGYLRSSLPQDASPKAQADAFAVLLNLLEIERVAVVAASAGALSGVQFALRYPERCTALVLLSPAAWAPERPRVRPRLFPAVVFASSFNLWVASKLLPRRLERFIGSTAGEELTDSERESLRRIAEGLQPLDARKPGMLNDGRYMARREPMRLEQLRAPTLIMAAADDPWETLPAARYLAGHIPGARLIATDHGGHLLLGGLESLTREAGEFLRANAPPGPRPLVPQPSSPQG